MEPITIYRGTTGINTVDDAVRLGGAEGIIDCALIENMTVDRSNRANLRAGNTLVTPGDFHSLYNEKTGPCYVIEELTDYGNIMQVANDLSTRGVRSGLTKNRHMSWAKEGEKIFYANGRENGLIINGVSNFWPDMSKHVGQETDRVFFPAPVAEHLAIAFGRMWLSFSDGDHHLVVYSEPYAYGKFHLAKCYWEFTSRVRMIQPVAAGLYISTEDCVWFYNGVEPDSVEPRIVADFPALEWSAAYDMVEGTDLGFNPGRCALWASPEGAMLGHADGYVINLNKEKVIYPEDVRQGAGLLRGYNFWHMMK